MKYWIRTVFAWLVIGGVIAAEVPQSVQKYMDGAIRIGETRVNVLFWDLYDISLYSQNGQFSLNEPFAIRLKYLRNIKGKVIAEKSIEEMRRQGIGEIKLAGWFTQLEKVMPDVREGTELIGIFMPGESTRFYEGDQYIGQVMDPDFGKPFSDIWLGDKSSIPRIRESLLKGRLDQ